MPVMAYLKRDDAVKQLREAQARIQELETATAALRDDQQVMLSARVPRSLREQARHLGARQGLSMQETVQEALAQWVEAAQADLDT